MFVNAVLGLFLGLAVIFALKYAVSLRGLSETASEEYEHRTKKGYDFNGASKAAFIRAYRRVYGPRASLFTAATLLLLSVLTWPLLKSLELIFEYGWRWGGQDRAYEPGYLVWQFMLFGGLIVGWAVIVYCGARLYHRGAPQGLSVEIEREKNNGN